ncbi:hypothetical protein MPTK1_5g19140 [Marchantia polymorpha subsp. ruderalis]|uniref:Uncharacterized protein n=2 Tax=Marchantia polymorpha TaxID=3197 RepID=A0AAF6BJZ0_MARPO|nr:hypothetical protein MARPO_0073s0029 [Marchantia polymorpha]BBN12324.1 hypothetical protein Mp_5g19140 [Marchantia polymorpha subsp. ruderalis]|eukprot:PTQ35152.1 hypothetical protein MARPO_0073s0029 [Marchantia polymorpha]
MRMRSVPERTVTVRTSSLAIFKKARTLAPVQESIGRSVFAFSALFRPCDDRKDWDRHTMPPPVGLAALWGALLDELWQPRRRTFASGGMHRSTIPRPAFRVKYATGPNRTGRAGPGGPGRAVRTRSLPRTVIGRLGRTVRTCRGLALPSRFFHSAPFLFNCRAPGRDDEPHAGDLGPPRRRTGPSSRSDTTTACESPIRPGPVRCSCLESGVRTGGRMRSGVRHNDNSLTAASGPKYSAKAPSEAPPSACSVGLRSGGREGAVCRLRDGRTDGRTEGGKGARIDCQGKGTGGPAGRGAGPCHARCTSERVIVGCAAGCVAGAAGRGAGAQGTPGGQGRGQGREVEPQGGPEVLVYVGKRERDGGGMYASPKTGEGDGSPVSSQGSRGGSAGGGHRGRPREGEAS